jgi:chemotaxis protein methyltransferase CheR
MESAMDSASNSIYNINKIFKTELSHGEFNKLSQFIMSEYGIKMPPEKKIMLQSRLQKRLKILGIDNFKEYLEYLFSKHGMSEEVIHMMDVVSTNKTDFFREPAHFDFMLSESLPNLQNSLGVKNFKIWSAGCSSGEEPYTLAITMSEYKETHNVIDYSIFASDISTQVLKTAINAIYNEERIKDIPLTLKKKYFLRSKKREELKGRVIAELRNKIEFARVNLLDINHVSVPKYHIIFCRNVFIYFDRATQLKILNALCSNIIPGGYLFLGHSESITGLDLPLTSIIPTVFIKK